MQNLVPYVTRSGDKYNIPPDQEEAFRADFGEDAQPAASFRTKDGESYQVPQSMAEDFRKDFPDAQPTRRLSFANGTTRDFTSDELRKFFQDEYITSPDYKQDRDEDDARQKRQMEALRLAQSEEEGKAESERRLAEAKKQGEERYDMEQRAKSESRGTFWQELGRRMFTAEGIRENAQESVFARPYAYLNDLANSLVGGLLKGSAKIEEGFGRIWGETGDALGNKGIKDAARAMVADAQAGQAAVDRNLPTDMLDTQGKGAVNKVLQVGKNVAGMTGEFAPAAIPGVGQAYAASLVSAGTVNRYAQVYDEATRNGIDPRKADGLAFGAATVDALTNMLLMGKFRGVWSGEKKAMADMAKKRFVQRALGVGMETAKVGGTMAANGAWQEIVDEGAKGAANPDWAKVGSVAFDQFIEGGLFHLVNSGAHHATRIDWSKEPDGIPAGAARDMMESPEGRALIFCNSPQAAAQIFRARKNGEDVSRKMIRDLGLSGNTGLTVADRNAIGDRLLADYQTFKERVRTKMDDVQASALADEIASRSDEGYDSPAFEKVWMKAVAQIKDAREIDDPERRKEIVDAALSQTKETSPKAGKETPTPAAPTEKTAPKPPEPPKSDEIRPVEPSAGVGTGNDTPEAAKPVEGGKSGSVTSVRVDDIKPGEHFTYNGKELYKNKDGEIVEIDVDKDGKRIERPTRRHFTGEELVDLPDRVESVDVKPTDSMPRAEEKPAGDMTGSEPAKKQVNKGKGPVPAPASEPPTPTPVNKGKVVPVEPKPAEKQGDADQEAQQPASAAPAPAVNKGKGKKPVAPAKPPPEPKRTFVDDFGKTHEVNEDISRQLRQEARSKVNLICNTKNKTSIETARKQVKRVAASMTNDDLSASLAETVREERRNTTGGKASDILLEEAKSRGLEVTERPKEMPQPGEWIVGRVDGDSSYAVAGRVLSADARGIVVQYYGGHNKVRAGRTVGEETFKALVPTDAVDLAIRDPSRPAKASAKSPAVAAADDFVVRNTTLSRDGAAVANDDINHQGEVKPPPRTEDEPRKPFAKPLKIVDAPAAAKEMAGHASQDGTRKALTGVHVEKGLMVATDGRHMVIAPAPKGWTDGEYGADGKPVGDDRVYPNWRQVVSDVKKVGYSKIGTVANGDAATDAVDFASALRKKVVAVTKYDNDAPTVAIGDAACNPSYVSDILGTMFRLGAKSVDVWHRDGKCPVVFKGRNADGEITAVLMPLRYNGESAAERGFTHVRMPLEAPPPKNKGKGAKAVQAAKPLGSPDAASPLRPAPKGAKLVQGEFDGMGGETAARLEPGADLSKPENAKVLVDYFKTYEGSKPPPMLPQDTTPQSAYKWFSENIVGRRFEIGDRTFTPNPGHFFRFVCGTPKGTKKRKGWIDAASSPEEARRMIDEGKVADSDIAGYVKSRAMSLPMAVEVLTSPDAIITRGYKEYLIKKFNTGNKNSDVMVFLLNDDGKTLGLESTHVRAVGAGFLNGSRLVKLNGEATASPVSAGEGTTSTVDAERSPVEFGDMIPRPGGEVKGGSEKPQKTLDGQTIDPTGEKTGRNPLGKALAPKDGSIEQEIDAEIAADEALAAKGGGKPQGVPPAPAPGSAGNPSLDPSYEPEAFGSGIEGNPIARQQVIDKFRELFGDKVAIRGKNTRTLGPTVAGHFEPDAHIIRSKDPISLRTIPHEIGHFIDALLRRRGLARPPAVRHDLIALGKLLYGKKQPNGGYESEGFAEMLKYYMQGNDAGLRKDAPAAYDWFMNRFAPANPDTMARIDAMRDMIDRFQNQSAVQAVRGISAPDKKLGQKIVDRIADAANALKPTQENWIDKGAFITKAMKASGINRLYDWRDALKRGDVAEATRIIENHPVLKWKLYNGKAGMRAFVALKNGLTDLSGTRRYTYGDLGVTTPGHAPDEPLPTFREIFGDFTKRELDDFKHEYAIARVAKELYLDRGLEFGLTEREVNTVLRKYANNAKFRDALDRYTHYKHGVLHLLVDAGAMSQQQFEAIVAANPIYAKIARRRESTDFFRNAMLRRGGKAVNERKGGGQMIEDIFDAGLVDDERIFRAAFQADLFRSLVRAGELAEANNAAPGGALQGTFSVGANWIKEVPNAKETVTFTPEKLRKQVVDALNAAGAEAPSNVAGQPPLRGDKLFDALFGTGDNLTIFKERPSDGKNGIVSIYGEDGKLRTFELPENNAEGWAKGLLDFTDGKNASILEKWAEISVAGVRAGATMLNPEFALRNLMRDTFHAATMNQHGTFIPVVGSLEGLYHDLMGTAPKQMFEAMGLEMGGMLGRSRLASARKSNRYLMSSNWLEAQMRKGLTKAVADLVGVTENATRIKQFKLAYENMLRQGVSDKAARMIAGCNALDTTIDFLRSGYTGQKINRIVPFFNAGVQGLDQFARALGMLEPKAWDVKDSRFYRLGRTLLQGLAFLTTAALFSELYNRSDPERKRKAEELPPHERWNYISFGDLRIPVPYEAGYLFASIPRAVAAAAIDGDEKAVSECLKMFATTFPLQVDSLHGFMRNAAFVGPLADVAFNEDWKYKTIVQQHVKDGKESWEWYGPRTTGLSKDLGKALHKVIGDSYFSAPAYLDTIFDGYSGGMYSKLARLAYGEADFSFDTSRPSDWPVIGTFFRRPESSRIPNDFYDERAKLERKAGSGTATIAEYGRLSAMDSIAKDIRPYWDANRRLMADRDMPRKERLDRMDENTRKATDAIRAMSKDEAELRSHGMKALAAKLANPSATGDSWERAAKMLKADGATLQETQSALRLYGRAHGWTRDTVNKRLRLLSARWK